MQRTILHPLTPQLVFSVVLTAMLATYVVAGLEPSDEFQTAAGYIWLILVVWWIVTDARRQTGIPCFDFGLFCYLSFPLSVPWYCFWSRGWQGLFLLLFVSFLFIVPYIIASLVALLLYG